MNALTEVKTMLDIFKTAVGVRTILGLGGLAIAGIIMIGRTRGRVSAVYTTIILLVVVVVLGEVMLQKEKAQERVQEHADLVNATYRVRVTVLNPEQQPMNDATVTSSVNAIAKKVDGGYEFEIPASIRPANGKLVVYGMVESAFWKGHSELQLADDHNPNVTIQLAADETATVRGIVEDQAQHALEGVAVSLVGYGSEAVTTKVDGNFTLPAHAAGGQQTQLHAERSGYKPVNQYQPAGRHPATLVLEKLGER